VNSWGSLAVDLQLIPQCWVCVGNTHLFKDLKGYHHTHKTWLLDPVLSHLNQSPTLISNYFKISLNMIFLYTQRSPCLLITILCLFINLCYRFRALLVLPNPIQEHTVTDGEGLQYFNWINFCGFIIYTTTIISTCTCKTTVWGILKIP
jgi:hypothetical protein